MDRNVAKPIADASARELALDGLERAAYRVVVRYDTFARPMKLRIGIDHAETCLRADDLSDGNRAEFLA